MDAVDMKTVVVEALEKAKADIQANMEAKDINATGNTSRSFRVEVYQGGVRLVMGGENTAPLETLEIGVAPEQAPKSMRTFMAILIDWSRAKGIPFDSERDRRSFAYLLGRRIQREGTLRHQRPVDVYSTIVTDTAEQLKKDVAVKVTQFVHNLMNN